MEPRIEIRVDGAVEERLSEDIRSALRRKPVHEGRLAGAARVLALHSASIRRELDGAVRALAERGAVKRPLYEAGVRVTALLGARRMTALLANAMEQDQAGGLATLSAACFTSSAELSAPLAHVVMRRSPHLAFAAEIARVVRGESSGQALTSIAARIKESYRIDLCSELMVPLLWHGKPLSVDAGVALGVLRGAERHLGRWLVLAESAVRAGDDSALKEAALRAKGGPAAAQAAWSLVHWALASCEDANKPVAQPAVKPTAEVVARLSDRPSAKRDPSFLFRMAAARLTTTRAMLESMVKAPRCGPENSLRAMLHLVRDYDCSELKPRLIEIARGQGGASLRGLAGAALYDVGEHSLAVELCVPVCRSRDVSSATWAALVGAVAAAQNHNPLVDEPTFRRIQGESVG